MSSGLGVRYKRFAASEVPIALGIVIAVAVAVILALIGLSLLLPAGK